MLYVTVFLICYNLYTICTKTYPQSLKTGFDRFYMTESRII